MQNQPDLIGARYHLEKKLGAGGMGTVYRALDRLTGETVALKQVQVISSDADSNTLTQNLRLALTREFQTLASLRHPNIIGVLDYGFDVERQPYFTMRYLDDALNVLEVGQVSSLTEQVHLWLQLLQALVYLHRRRILHRDLKPANVLVQDGQVKVLDFGLSVQRGYEVRGTSGTLAYMAPELLQNELATEASDLYAVGVMAYEMITGQVPFANPMAILTAVPDFAPLGDNEALTAVIQTLLAKNPADRYPTAEATMEALCRAVGQTPPAETREIRESFLQAATFIGRETELNTLRQQLHQALHGQGSSWLVGGESGVGKSRLSDELRILALVEGMTVLRGQAVSGPSPLYQLWREPVRHLLLTTAVTDLQASILQEIVPQISALLGREIPPLAPLSTAKEQQNRLILQIIDLFRRQTRPVLLLLEDLQWTEESLEVLKLLTQFVPQWPLLVVATYRQDERPSLPQDLPEMSPMLLERLPAKEIARLSEAILGPNGRSPELLTLLQKETEGNVFFLVETLRALAEEAGQLSEIGHLVLPERILTQGIASIIQRRLAKLPLSAHTPLKLAAVAGRQLDLAVFHALYSPAIIEPWLTLCVNAAVFNWQDGRWQFSHDKLREALLAQLTPNEAPDLHRQIATAIRHVHQDNLAPYYADLATHYRIAQEPEEERHFAFLAGKQANQTYAYAEALAHLNRALALTPADNPALLFDTWLQKNLVYESQGDLIAHQDELEVLKQLAEQLDDDERRTEALLRYSLFYDLNGKPREVIEIVEQTLVLAQRTGNAAHEALSLLRMGRAYIFLRESSTAQTYLEQAIALARTHNLGFMEATGWLSLGNLAWYDGRLSQAQTAYEQALVVRRRVGDLSGEANLLNDLGLITWMRGDFMQTKAYFQTAVALARQTGQQANLGFLIGNWGELMLLLGDYAEARRAVEEALWLSQKTSIVLGEINARIILGRIQLITGRTTAAHHLFAEVLTYLQTATNRQKETEALRGLAWCEWSLDHLSLAETHARSAVQTAQKANLQLDWAVSLVFLGRVLLALHQMDEAQNTFAQAMVLYEASGSSLLAALTGQAEVAWVLGQVAEAETAVQRILDILTTESPYSLEDPAWLYVVCLQILQGRGDARVAEILAQGNQWLEERFANFATQADRDLFLTAVPSHRQLWETVQSAKGMGGFA